ncbi:glycosyl transferase family 90-domain-containing protein [Macrophomina phaseolina]|uniref:Glycosyl transferase family 90-domain-containing protein n=1 Tax=Macrophomina phaseolina TaxID=35725 RepID=A0ABQ8GH61_9PEZI|nr:glycosyl transferase family 90-domain-containing protein [Macrophomina phaseolina]
MSWKSLLSPSSPRYTPLGFPDSPASRLPPRRILYAGAAAVATIFVLATAGWHVSNRSPFHDPSYFETVKLPEGYKWKFDPSRDSLNYGLTDEQCNAAFPDLFLELDRAQKFFSDKKIQQKDVHLSTDAELNDHWNGKTRAEFHLMIYNGELIVIDEAKGEPDRSRGLAAMASMYRAINAHPNPRDIPNVEFILDLHDNSQPGPDGKIRFTWARHKDNPYMWVVPDFDGWTYPDDAVGSYVQFRNDVAEIEKPFEDKIPQLSWRGSLGVNHGLRQALMDASEGKGWSDVKAIDWRTRSNVLAMKDFCNYQYVAHTEGNTWSGRLRYLHNCNSVPVIHELDWVAHYYPLLQDSGKYQNYVKVKRDFSDLDEKMQYLVDHPHVAKRIAAQSAQTFRDRYLTPAAEACYWRRMFAHYASVLDFEPRLYDEEVVDGEVVRRLRRGQTFERFAFRGKDGYEHGIFDDSKDKAECKNDTPPAPATPVMTPLTPLTPVATPVALPLDTPVPIPEAPKPAVVDANETPAENVETPAPTVNQNDFYGQ